MVIDIREETAADIESIREVNRCAFGQDHEGSIVDALRSNGGALLSLVATLNGQVVGHIMYSPIVVGGTADGAALGPVAVLKEYQRQGIGSSLILAGNQRLKDIGCPFIMVIGHPHYYPRFGFMSASSQGITCEWDYRTKRSCFLCWTSQEGKSCLDRPNIGVNSRASLK